MHVSKRASHVSQKGHQKAATFSQLLEGFRRAQTVLNTLSKAISKACLPTQVTMESVSAKIANRESDLQKQCARLLVTAPAPTTDKRKASMMINLARQAGIYIPKGLHSNESELARLFESVNTGKIADTFSHTSVESTRTEPSKSKAAIREQGQYGQMGQYQDGGEGYDF